METAMIEIDKKIGALENKLKIEFSNIATQAEKFVKRCPQDDKLDDLHERLYEARLLLHVLNDVLVGHGRKVISELEDEINNATEKQRYIDMLENYMIRVIPGMVNDAVMSRIKCFHPNLMD